MSKLIDDTSKFLSYILRHEPQSIGLSLDREGWADITTLIEGAKNSGKTIDRELVQLIVNASGKKRFSISSDGLRIRATQGHSTMCVEISYPEKTPPEILYHGTATRFLESIMKEGLRPIERHHVHLSHDVLTATAAGLRYGKPVVLKIEALKMHQNGIKFYLADNGVWLTKYIAPIFIVGTQHK